MALADRCIYYGPAQLAEHHGHVLKCARGAGAPKLRRHCAYLPISSLLLIWLLSKPQ